MRAISAPSEPGVEAFRAHDTRTHQSSGPAAPLSSGQSQEELQDLAGCRKEPGSDASRVDSHQGHTGQGPRMHARFLFHL